MTYISKNVVAEFLQARNINPDTEVIRFPYKFRIIAGRVSGSYPHLNEGDFMLTLPKRISLNEEQDINYEDFVYNIIIYAKKYENINYEAILISDTVLVRNALKFLYMYLKEGEETKIDLHLFLGNLLETYNNIITFHTGTTIKQNIIMKSISNGPFDYITDGVEIYQVNEQNPPF